MIHWMFNCKEAAEKVSRSMDAAPPIHHRMMITIHLLMCKYCNRFRKQPMILRNAVRLEKLPEDHPSPPGSLSKATVRGLKRPPERSRLDKI